MKKIFLGIIFLSFILFSFVFLGLREMAIEDRYGEFYVLYDKIDDDEKYIISIESNQFGFVEKLGDDIFVEIDGCYKPILNYSNDKIEIFKFKVSETFITFSKPDFDRIKKLNTTHLIFKN